MAELSAGAGLEGAATRGRGGWGEFFAAVRDRLPKRRTGASAPEASSEETVVLRAGDDQVLVETTTTVLETVILETENQIPEAGADEAALEFKRQLEELNREFVLVQVREAALPEKAESPIGIFGKELSPEAKAAFLALRAELVKPVAEAGAEGAPAEDAQVILSEEGEAAFTLLVAELRAKLAPVAGIAPEAAADVVEKEAITSVPVTHFEDEDAGASPVEGAGDSSEVREALELEAAEVQAHRENDVVETVTEAGAGDNHEVVAVDAGDNHEVVAADAGDHEVVAVGETHDALVVLPTAEGDQLKDGRVDGEDEQA